MTTTQNGNRATMQSDLIVQWIAWFQTSYPVTGALLVMMAIDIAMGLCAAFRTKTISSSASFAGMVKKGAMLLMLGMGAVLEPFSGDIPVSKLVSLCFLVTEGLSILENAKRVGIPIPAAITDALSKLRSTSPATTPTSPTQQVEIKHASNVNIATPPDGSSSGVLVAGTSVGAAGAGAPGDVKSSSKSARKSQEA